jgi:hypothetical protein
MIVQAVGRELRERGAATASQLVAELGARRSYVESALSFWIHRGNVTVCRQPAASCGTACRACPIGVSGPPRTTAPEVYEWVSRH